LVFIPTPANGQLPTIQDLVLYSNNLLHNNSNDEPVASCIRIDGRCAFKIAFPKSELSDRINEIQYRLNEIKEVYLNNPDSELQINYRQENGIANVYVRVDDNPIRLLTVTQQDANFQGMTVKSKTELVVDKLEKKLLQAKRQRQSDYLIRQIIIGITITIAIAIISYLLYRFTKKIRQEKSSLKAPEVQANLPFITYLKQRKSWYFQDIKHRLLQLSQILLWLLGILVVLGLFPQTRTLQLIIITAIRLPLRVVLIATATYFIIRFIYSLINNLAATIIGSQFVLSPRANKRLQLRVNTISQVSKSIIAILLIIVSILFSLAAIGIDTTPFLAGAGIIGLALSFSSQSFIKDALNGFLIIFEDQYAVGDVINLNDVGGMVENINLRITQIRDAEGRLITIPNSEVKIVANLSSQWSRADLSIPLSYDTNLDRALKVITQVAMLMSEDEQWKEYILEPPEILGVENFSDRGIIVRVWIITEPLKQWDVSREFRRRLQIAFTDAGMPLTPPQQIWLDRGISNGK
jgi:small conductance mechanosensitive channel